MCVCVCVCEWVCVWVCVRVHMCERERGDRWRGGKILAIGNYVHVHTHVYVYVYMEFQNHCALHMYTCMSQTL